MWRLVALSLVTGAPPSPPAQFGFIDAARLIALCEAKAPDAASARSLCLGYVVGAVDQLFVQQARRGRPTICPPGDLTADHVLQAVLRHSRFASKADGLSAAGFVRRVMEDSFPCAEAAGVKGF